jgi:hypothetical protein
MNISQYYNQAIRVLQPLSEFRITENDLSTLFWFNDAIPRPTDEQIIAEATNIANVVPINNCKQTAKSLLAASDWSMLPDVGLQNTQDYIAYRAVLRNYVLHPVANPDFPTEPQPIWT